MHPQEPTFYPWSAAKRAQAEPSSGPCTKELLPEFSYLENLRFCGVGDETGIKYRVGSCSTGCGHSRVTLQPWGSGVPSCRFGLTGNFFLAVQEISHSSQQQRLAFYLWALLLSVGTNITRSMILDF